MSTPAPGTAAYFPSVLARIHEACPELPVDPVTLQSILLCLVASDEGSNSRMPSHTGKNLILRTRDEDIGLVLNLTELVSYFSRTIWLVDPHKDGLHVRSCLVHAAIVLGASPSH